jgi:hypothetical protein
LRVERPVDDGATQNGHREIRSPGRLLDGQVVEVEIRGEVRRRPASQLGVLGDRHLLNGFLDAPQHGHRAVDVHACQHDPALGDSREMQHAVPALAKTRAHVDHDVRATSRELCDVIRKPLELTVDVLGPFGQRWLVVPSVEQRDVVTPVHELADNEGPNEAGSTENDHTAHRFGVKREETSACASRRSAASIVSPRVVPMTTPSRMLSTFGRPSTQRTSASARSCAASA